MNKVGDLSSAPPKRRFSPWRQVCDLASAQQPKSVLSTFRGVVPPSAVQLRRHKGVRPVWFRPFHDSSRLGPYVRPKADGEEAAAR